MDQPAPHTLEQLVLRLIDPDATEPGIALLAHLYDIIVAVDTEYVPHDDGSQTMVSYQLAICNPATGLSFTTWSPAREKGKHPRPLFSLQEILSVALGRAEKLGLGKGQNGAWPLREKVKLALVMHHSRADLPALADFKRIKSKFDSIRKSFATLSRPLRMTVDFTGRSPRRKSRTVSISLFDTAQLVPQGMQSLAAIGKLLGFEKETVPEVVDEKGITRPGIERMDLVLAQWPDHFVSYATKDAEITLKWVTTSGRFYGSIGLERMPRTISSAAQALLLKRYRGPALAAILRQGAD